jgi:hypothetical protein
MLLTASFCEDFDQVPATRVAEEQPSGTGGSANCVGKGVNAAESNRRVADETEPNERG